MARSLSVNFREAINAQEDGRVAIFLLTVEHDDLDSPSSPLRFSGDPTERVSDVPLVYKTVSRGEDYIYLPMEIVLPDEREGSAPHAQIRISNVNRAVLPMVRSVTTPARAKIELLFYDGESPSSLDDVEIETPWLDIISIRNQAQELSLDLTLNSMTAEMLPTDSFDPAAFPGLFSTL